MCSKSNMFSKTSTNVACIGVQRTKFKFLRSLCTKNIQLKMNEEKDCRVLSIQSHVVSGYVGNKSATFPLQVLGFDVDTINSVQFSNHTGYEVFKGQVLNAEDLEALYSGLAANDINHYSHLLTGYIGSKSFLLAVRDVIKDQKRLNPNLIYVCDPVMGDHGKLYVPEDLLSVYKESIIPLADIITPNQFEAELLTDIKITDIESAKAAMLKLHNMGTKMVVISSSDLGLENDTLIALASNFKNGTSESLKIDIPKLPFDFTGTGDLFAALLLAWTHHYPDNLKLACEMVLSTMHQVLKKTLAWSQRNKKDGEDLSVAQTELRLIQCKNDIENPQLSIQATIL